MLTQLGRILLQWRWFAWLAIMNFNKMCGFINWLRFCVRTSIALQEIIFMVAKVICMNNLILIIVFLNFKIKYTKWINCSISWVATLQFVVRGSILHRGCNKCRNISDSCQIRNGIFNFYIRQLYTYMCIAVKIYLTIV